MVEAIGNATRLRCPAGYGFLGIDGAPPLIENSACGLLFRTRMSRPMGLRLIRRHAGRIFALLLLAAFLCALTVASSPRLHEKLHHIGRHHECAATLLASGSCEQAVLLQITPTVEKA